MVSASRPLGIRLGRIDVTPVDFATSDKTLSVTCPPVGLPLDSLKA